MKWLKRIVITLVVLVLLVVLVGWLLPNEYSVERSVVIDADAAQVHRLVGELTQWPAWTPWLEMDPTTQTTFGEITTGVGARQSWTGNSGNGELVFTQCDEETGIVYDLSFDEGKYQCVGAMTYESADGGTRVTWSMDGELPGVRGAYRVLMMDWMVGSAFEKGLANLKVEVEALPAPEDIGSEELTG